jgi:hypothetical protein
MPSVLKTPIFEDLTNVGLSDAEIKELWKEVSPYVPGNVNELSYKSTIDWHRTRLGRKMLVTYGLRKSLENVELINTHLNKLVGETVRATQTSKERPVVIFITHDMTDIYYVIYGGDLFGLVSYGYSRGDGPRGILDGISVDGTDEFVNKFKDVTNI